MGGPFLDGYLYRAQMWITFSGSLKHTNYPTRNITRQGAVIGFR